MANGVQKTEIVKSEPAAQLVKPAAENSLLEVIERAARDPNVDIEKMERLFALMEKSESAKRAAAYADAMARCQAEIQPVRRTGAIVHNGRLISKFAKLEDLDEVIRPVTSRHGFSLSFNATPLEGGKTRHTLKVTHRDGHFETFDFDAAPDAGGAKNAIQAAGSSTTYARRYLTKGAFNIVESGEDDDGAASGKPTLMTPEHVAEIKRLMQDARDAGLPGFEDARMLNWKQVLSFEDLRDDEFPSIVERIKANRKQRETEAQQGGRR